MKRNLTTAALGLVLAFPVYAQQRDPAVGGQQAQPQPPRPPQQQQQQQGQRTQQQQGQQAQSSQQQGQSSQQQGQSSSWLSSSKLNGAEVKNQQQESVGTISELIINPENAMVIFGVVETRNFLGLNQTRYVIPWKAFRVERNLEEADEVELTLDTTREKLEKSFEYNEDQMSNINPQEVYAYWGEDFRQTRSQGQQQEQPKRPQGQEQPSPTTPMRERESGEAQPRPGSPGTPDKP